jgi:hypothetical protein
MMFAIDFDRQSADGTIEVENIITGFMLPSEIMPARFLPQLPPKSSLRRRHFAA